MESPARRSLAIPAAQPVILYGRDEDVKVVLAESLGKFLDWIAHLLESGNYRLNEAPGEDMLRQFRLKNPPTDHFHEGARLLLGAPGQYLYDKTARTCPQPVEC